MRSFLAGIFASLFIVQVFIVEAQGSDLKHAHARLCSTLLTHAQDLSRLERIISNNHLVQNSLAQKVQTQKFEPAEVNQGIEVDLEQAFNHYLSLRIETLTELFGPEENAWLEIGRRVQNTVNRTLFEFRDYLNGEYQPTHDTITLVLPRSLQHSISHFITLTHEVEHAFQVHLIDHHTQNRNQNEASLPDSQSNKLQETSLEHFLLEKGAMLAEQQFILLLPEQTYELAMADFQARVEASQFSEAFKPEIDLRLLRLQDSRRLSPEHYIRAEHIRGRNHPRLFKTPITLRRN